MVITEIFRSIQGESSYAGLPCIFVRLTGCNLRCTWCDTAYAFYGGSRRTIAEIIVEVRQLAQAASPRHPAHSRYSIRLVEITGGEPMLQPEVPELARTLLDAGFTVLIETSGERPLHSLPAEVIKIVDVKCPDSGEADTFDIANLDSLTSRDEIKFVIATRRDYEFAREFMGRHALAQRVPQILFSPVFADPEGKWPALEPRELVRWMLEDALPARLSLQLHKFIWDPAMHAV
jgi:7-carboxy-7-deazaguanine synthase